ncbi:hypothetical protein G7046_g7097 [Stylonectria norvegica]|nr:hypothetical protein G7046_g7097 [Stylonectria norvegica]
MSSDVLNFNKPCSACRRRKVRCDKAQPCNNCVRHHVSCVYEAPRESVLSQQLLQDRVERLERMVEDMAAFSLSNSGSGRPNPRSDSSENSPFSSADDYSDIPTDAGSQVFRPGSSYHMGPDFWMNIDQFSYEPRDLLHVDSTSHSGEQFSWPLSPSSPTPHDVTQFHLPLHKEDALIGAFFDYVEPFIRMNHQGYYWQMVNDFRQETSAFGDEVEALMFATQYITASVLPSEIILEKTGLAKSDLRSHLQRATEAAFHRANLMRSRNTILFNALMYYITCQFHIGNYEVGATLLGLAGSMARRIGVHRDPAYYGYAAWIVEVRRRMWGHLAALDAQFSSMDGSESILTSLGDVQRSLNASDSEWKPSRFVGSDPGPRDQEGFSDTTAALMRRELSRTCHAVAEARKTATDCDSLLTIIDASDKYLRLKFIHHFDNTDPIQSVITSWSIAMIKSLQVSVLYFHASPSRLKLHCHSFDQLQGRLYDDCLTCLEEFEQGEIAATPEHWQWAFRWPMPLHVIGGLLSCLARQPDHIDTDRAWEQIEVVFRRYNNEDISMVKVPAWHAIETLCDEAMLQHPNRVHEGCSYVQRVHKKNPVGARATMDGKSRGLYDVDLYESDMGHTTLPGMFSVQATNPNFSADDIESIFFHTHGDHEIPSLDI